ncbi:MAG: hypothetical protein R3E39_13585 [Anaerolineae bacterium]
MAKRSNNRTPIEQYDRFMLGGKTPATFRGVVHLGGAFVGNSVIWLLGQITIARLGMVFALFLIAAIAFGILRQVLPTLDWQPAIILSTAVGLLMVSMGTIILRLILARDAERLSKMPTFGVNDEDIRVRKSQKYRRKAGR